MIVSMLYIESKTETRVGFHPMFTLSHAKLPYQLEALNLIINAHNILQ